MCGIPGLGKSTCNTCDVWDSRIREVYMQYMCCVVFQDYGSLHAIHVMHGIPELGKSICNTCDVWDSRIREVYM